MSTIQLPVTTLVIQPTSFCNLNCDYCYISEADRSRKGTIDVRLLKVLAADLHELATVGQPVEVLWHAGEPLTVGARRFRDFLEPFESLRRAGVVRHGVQTNATLIDAAWCELFRSYDIGVGVSIDGPGYANRHRVSRAGVPSLDQALRGVGQLAGHGIPFGAISVVSIEGLNDPVSCADELFDFFSALGCRRWGVNFEERETANAAREVPDDDRVTKFWGQVYRRWSKGRSFEQRELVRAEEWLIGLRAGLVPPEQYALIPTVDQGGNVYFLSPELVGASSPRYENFVVGSLHDETLLSLVGRATDTPYVRDFVEGARNCLKSCPLGTVCQAGSTASSKWAEHGTLTSTETAYCRNSFMRPAQAVLSAWQNASA